MIRMAVFQIPMHDDGRLVSLEAILAELDGTGVEWWIVDLQAVGEPGSGLDVLELEKEVRRKPEGLALSDLELRALATQFHQVIECEIVGVETGKQGTGDADLSIVAFDSTEWTVKVNPASAHRVRADSLLLL